MSKEDTTTPQGDVTIHKRRKVVINSDADVLEAAIRNHENNIARIGFQAALHFWRTWAHRRGLIVASPICVVGRETTAFGDSDDLLTVQRRHFLEVRGDLVAVGKLFVDKKELANLNAIYPDLVEQDSWRIYDLRAPSTKPVPEQEDERGRWDLGLTDRHIVGTVVRVGEKETKRYLLFLWNNGWHRQEGAPPFDLPLFGRHDLGEHPHKPVMVHEGPKAWDAARKNPALADYVHVSWHAAEPGMEWTDWSPLRGRDVLVWSDCDDAGVRTARDLALRIARLGGLVGYMNWSAEDMKDHPRWDWADPDGLRKLSAHEREMRVVRVESPTLADGRLNPDWLSRSFWDAGKREIYQQSTGYAPIALDTLAIGQRKGFKEALVNSAINPFRGIDYRPGLPPGKLADGKINICPPLGKITPREPTKRVRRLYRRWIMRMIPNRIQRARLLLRIILAVRFPERVPQHMIVLQGDSGIGKSLLLTFIARIVGRQHAVEVVPDDIFGRFNDRLVHNLVACVHEIHSEDITRKQNTHRLKELIANPYISVEAKNRPRMQMTNVIHWFGATNEEVPVILSHGNNRFYFIPCVHPGIDLKQEAVPFLEDEEFMAEVRSSCAWLMEYLRTRPRLIDSATGRAKRQDVWEALQEAAKPGWAQEVDGLLERFEESGQASFFADQVISLLRKRGLRCTPHEVRRYLNRRGYMALNRKEGRVLKEYKRGTDNGVRMTLWAREGGYDSLMKTEADKITRYHFRDSEV